MRISNWSSDMCSSDLVAHQQGRLGVVDKGFDLDGGVSAVERHEHRSDAQCRQVKQHRFGGLFDLHRNPVAGRDTDSGESGPKCCDPRVERSEEPTTELQSLMRTSYAGFCLKKKRTQDWRARRRWDAFPDTQRPFSNEKSTRRNS